MNTQQGTGEKTIETTVGGRKVVVHAKVVRVSAKECRALLSEPAEGYKGLVVSGELTVKQG